MDCIILCNKDAPEICAEDITRITGKEASILSSACLVTGVSKEEIASLTYYCQSAHKVVPVLFTLNTSLLDSNGDFEEDTCKKLLTNNAPETLTDTEKELLENATSFALRVSKHHSLSIPSTDIEAVIGGWYHDRIRAHGMKQSVNLENPELPLHCVMTSEATYIGVDVVGFDLSKRPYKLMPYPSSLNGVMAYTIARLAGITKTSVVVDPFCGSGTIPIETALYQNGISTFALEHSFNGFSIPMFKDSFEKIQKSTREKTLTATDRVIGYDNQFKVVTLTKKHAKLAHVKDAMIISKVDIDWIDMKFEADSVDVIVTNPPKENRKTNNHKEIKKLYDEFCYQIRHILKPDGTAAVLLVRPELLIKMAEPHNLSVKKKLSIHSGKQKYTLVVLSKNSEKVASWE